MTLMAQALRSGQHAFKQRESWFELEESGLLVQPQFLELIPLDDGGVRTVTTIETSRDGTIPSGVFEFQHAASDNLQKSIIKGFEEWMTFDLPVFFDALRERQLHCTSMQIELPAHESRPARKRRAILGPVGHQVALPPPAEEEEHPFCPCCLFTRTWKALEPKFIGEGAYGVRLLALRHEDGTCGADCRVNGEAWPSGVEALVNYAATWPKRGVEMRKQFVILQDGTNAVVKGGKTITAAKQ